MASSVIPLSRSSSTLKKAAPSIFLLGVSLFHVLSNHRPWRGVTSNGISSIARTLIDCESDLTSLNNIQDGTTVHLCPMLFELNGQDEEVLVEADGVTISCSGNPGSCILDGGAKSGRTGRILNVTGYRFRVEGVTFQNANATNGSGGAVAIYEDNSTDAGGEYVIENCLFRNNTSYAHGGALNVDTELGVSNITLRGATFFNNQVVNGSTYGGAVNIEEMSHVFVEQSRFIKNKSVKGGAGALSAYQMDCLVMDTTIFRENYALQFGGAVIINEITEVIAKSLSVVGNQVDTDGGAGIGVYTMGRMTMDQSTVVANRAIGWGAGVYVEEVDELIVTNSAFANNKAAKGGGAGLAAESGVNITIYNSEFFKNAAQVKYGGGGAVALYNVGLTVTERSKFDRNSIRGGGDGGALYYEEIDEIVVSDCDFVMNRNIKGTGGGAIYIESVDLAQITKSSFTRNIATTTDGGLNCGGAMKVDNVDGVKLNNTCFVSNSAVVGGALCFLDETESSLPKTSMVGTSGTVNSAGTCPEFYFTRVRTLTNGTKLFSHKCREVQAQDASCISRT